MLVLINLPLIKLWTKILDIPKILLYIGILVIGVLRVYSLSASLLEVLLVCAIGLVGFFMRVYDFPVAPAILGVILGPMMETQLRRALSISEGDFSVFVTRPLTVVLLIISTAILLLPGLVRRIKQDNVAAAKRVGEVVDAIAVSAMAMGELPYGVTTTGPVERMRREVRRPQAGNRAPRRTQPLRLAPRG